MMASSMAGESDLPEPRERSKSCSNEQRPQPKPRKRVTKVQSVRYTGSRVRPGVSDSSPRETRSRSVLQPTPLVQAITNQLMNSINSNLEEKMQQREANNSTQKVDSDHDIKSAVNFSESVGSKNKLSPIVQRHRAHSEPRSHRDAPPRPPPPANPSPRLNRLITDYRASSSAPVHVIDSRSKALPSRSSPTSPKKTTKYGTPPPSRPAPSRAPPARSMDKEKKRGKGSPKSQNSPVPKPRTLLPRQKNAGSHDQDSQPSTKKAPAEDDVVTNEPIVDQSFPVYEELDKDDNNYEKIDPSSSSDDENEPTLTNFNSDAPPPPLPPKKGAKNELRHKKEEELPPLPPRTLPATTVRKHRLLANHTRVPDDNIISDKRKDSEEEENEEALQDTGVYEPVIYRDSDDESRKSEESYMEMTNPSNITDSDLENDQPEDIYITMDPHSYIPPPQTYKPKKKRAIFKAE